MELQEKRLENKTDETEDKHFGKNFEWYGYWHTDGETTETVTDFIFLGFKIPADDD